MIASHSSTLMLINLKSGYEIVHLYQKSTSTKRALFTTESLLTNKQMCQLSTAHCVRRSQISKFCRDSNYNTIIYLLSSAGFLNFTRWHYKDLGLISQSLITTKAYYSTSLFEVSSIS